VRVVAASDMADAARLLAADRGARFFAGGTLLMRAVNEGRADFTSLVRLAVRPRPVELRGDRMTLSATATMADILASRDLAFLHPAAHAVGGPAVRNMATVGGNLFAASPYGDFATALLALEARVALSGGRELPLADLLAARARDPRPLVESVAIQRPRQFRYLKASPVRPKRLSIMAIAASWADQGGRIGGARVAFGAMGPTPLRAPAVERALEGASLDATGIARAVAAAANDLDPPTDPIASSWYRREVAGVWLARCLLQRDR